ncbi:programmed cell death 1 ligand 2-like isoform 2-T3 [Anomaloglossus baeobatrachus]|uniref:programmed cell death 1 ligand 2-like isoform X1 n=1 Tax=Anomaloglossus baeobatrachus TaxID=238106 RepID=UPI003F4F7769
MLCFKLFLIMMDFQTILALFVVTAPKSTYTVRYGDTVQMVCKFPVTEQDDLGKLKVSWQHLQPKPHDEPSQVTMFNNGREDVLSQEKMYKGRASLITQELKNGMAILKIEEVKLTDAGEYLCVLQLVGSDFQVIMLKVQASYSKIVTSYISEENQVSLTCESIGFPEAEVYWKKNGVNVSSPVNTSITQTTDGFYKITSTIKGMDSNDSYQCMFWNKALNEKTEALLKHSGHTDLTDGLNSNTYPYMNDFRHHRQPIHTSVIITITIGFIAISFVAMLILCFKKRLWSFKCFKKKGNRSSAL